MTDLLLRLRFRSIAVLALGVLLAMPVQAQRQRMIQRVAATVADAVRSDAVTASCQEEAARSLCNNEVIEGALTELRADNNSVVRRIRRVLAQNPDIALLDSLRALRTQGLLTDRDMRPFNALADAKSSDEAKGAAYILLQSESLVASMIGATVIHLIEETESGSYDAQLAQSAGEALDNINWTELAGAAAAGAGIGALIGGPLGASIGAAAATVLDFFGQLFGGGDDGPTEGEGEGEGDGGEGGDGGSGGGGGNRP